MIKSYKEMSRTSWGSAAEMPANDEIQTGCLQRIADSAETIARNYLELLKENENRRKEADKYYQWYQNERRENEHLKRSITAHKANYTRLKNKQKILANVSQQETID
ncbi:MAG: hypothetical protein ACR2GD_11665 [Pyrinomonadaceae bacterium]